MRAETVLTRSEELRKALATGLESENLSQRELAALKLVAASAYDFSVAHDLMDIESTGEKGERERSAVSAIAIPPAVRKVLDTPLEAGMFGLLERERVVLPDEPMAARAQLEATIAAFLTDIPQQAATVSQTTLAGVINLGIGPAKGAISLATQEVLARVPTGVSLIVLRSATLVAEAITKLWTAIGPKWEAQARQQISDWLDHLQKQQVTVVSLLDWLYEMQRIRAEVSGQITSAPSGTTAPRYNQATQALEALSHGYDQTTGVLEWVLRVLALVKGPLMAAAPWGPVAAYSAYVGVLVQLQETTCARRRKDDTMGT